MRHRKRTCKLGRNTSHRRCLVANMLKSLIDCERIETTETKAKELRRHADKIITLGKKGTLAAKRTAIASLMIRYNKLSPKDARKAKKDGDTSSYNVDRRIINKLFDDLAKRFADRQGGYTRVIKNRQRIGDNASTAILEFVS